MAYLGAYAGLDFCQAGDTVFCYLFGKWRRFCAALSWFDERPGRFIRKAVLGELTVSLR